MEVPQERPLLIGRIFGLAAAESSVAKQAEALKISVFGYNTLVAAN